MYGFELNGVEFSIQPSRKSAIGHIVGGMHLVLAADDEHFTWEALPASGITRGQLIDIVDDNKSKIFAEFGLAPDTAVRIEMNGPGSATRQTVHMHIICAPNEAWEDIRRSVDPALPAKK